MKQQMRDVVTGEITLDYLVKRSADGWKIASIEWVRESAEEGAPVVAENQAVLTAKEVTAVPYGLQVAPDGSHLEENPFEASILLLMLEQIVREKRVTEIASQLNLAGYTTRQGEPWDATAVFNLLPRLIEVGPAVLKSHVWTERRSAPASKPN
jgi:hypothetical protein